ncbi:MAG: K(+)-transporting ATPase subunit F [Bacteroidales bacterium]|nr:K(+)-transporting ATPase subunit F [Bacteroidales bacterium]
MNAIILSITSQSGGISQSAGYIAGAVIALLLLAYLLYSLIKPEKF